MICFLASSWPLPGPQALFALGLIGQRLLQGQRHADLAQLARRVVSVAACFSASVRDSTNSW